MGMKFDKNLAAVHGYLCADGYVVRNPSTQKHKYYHIGLRNTNGTLLRDFQGRFKAAFGLSPIIGHGRCKISNKSIYHFLAKEYSYCSYEWRLPQPSKENLRHWLRAFFDCEGWVENQPAKSRLVGADCCNESGIFSVQKALRRFGVHSEIKKRTNRMIWRLTVCGKDDLQRFQEYIGFLHPKKKQKLEEAMSSYADYSWSIPETKDGLLAFVSSKGRTRQSRHEIHLYSIRKDNLAALKKDLNKLRLHSRLFGPWKNSTGSLYYCLTIKQKEVMNGQEHRETKGHNAGD